MFWHKKEENKTLPDLPPIRRPDFGFKEEEVINPLEEESEKQGLPSFPDSLNEKGFSQAAIKDAVGYVPGKNFKAVEMEEWTPSSRAPELPSMPLPIIRESSMEVGIQKGVKNTDVFVKIDKFYSARKALGDTQQKLEEMDELLRRIRETKLREEQELNGWDAELTKVKARVNEISGNLFEKVD